MYCSTCNRKSETKYLIKKVTLNNALSCNWALTQKKKMLSQHPCTVVFMEGKYTMYST
jgi:hypothetical protein